jgi:RecA/RadA recombinase
MSYTFKRAVREQVPLIIGLSGGTGSGKTFSAMRLAHGMAGSKPFCVIDTENGRASHYADQFVFDVLDLRAPFSPDAYSHAIAAADKAHYPVVVVDSMSHVWAGDGGVLDWQEAELDRMAGQDYGKREACKMAAWIKPKLAHKAMMSTLLQVNAHLILCFRAEEKIEMVRVNGKMEVRKKESLVGKDGWVPICEKNVPFEATCSFLLLASNPGKPHPIKLQEQHKSCFKENQCIDEFAGEQLAKWAAGGTKSPPPSEERQEPEMQTSEMLQQVHDAVNTAPNIFDQSSAVADHELAIDEAGTDAVKAQKAWDDVVNDKRLSTTDRSSLYARQQRILKPAKAKR